MGQPACGQGGDHCRFYVVNVDDGDGDRVIDLKYQKGQQDQDVQKTITLCELCRSDCLVGAEFTTRPQPKGTNR